MDKIQKRARLLRAQWTDADALEAQTQLGPLVLVARPTTRLQAASNECWQALLANPRRCQLAVQLGLAVQDGCVDEVRRALAAGADPDSALRVNPGEDFALWHYELEPLAVAALAGPTEVLELLLDAGATLNDDAFPPARHKRERLLIAMASAGRHEALALLADAGWSLDGDWRKNTCLHTATRDALVSGDLRVLQVVAQHADLEVRAGKTALNLALESRSRFAPAVAEALLAAGAVRSKRAKAWERRCLNTQERKARTAERMVKLERPSTRTIDYCERPVLRALKGRAGEDGVAAATYAELAALTGLHPVSVARALGKLVDVGLLRRLNVPHRPGSYQTSSSDAGLMREERPHLGRPAPPPA